MNNSTTVLHGDCRERLAEFPSCSVDSIVTDPPYGLSFIGKAWDHSVPGEPFWREALRVAKPGAHLLAFGGTRTYHRLACAIEDAGWEIRDCLMWVYGQGFPKSLDVSKAIDAKNGDERPKIGRAVGVGGGGDTLAWDGWGTALKPAWEPILMARKPLIGTVATNVLAHGTGGIHVDGCRVKGPINSGWSKSGSKDSINSAMRGKNYARQPKPDNAQGRWPANLIHDGSDAVVGLFPEAGKGSAARFFYCAKASKADRELGLKRDAPLMTAAEMVDRTAGSAGIQSPRAGAGRTTGSRNGHPTVKPTALMRYLVRLVTPPGGTVLDPFCGSGSTGVAATLEGFNFLGIDAEQAWAELAQQRIDGVKELGL